MAFHILNLFRSSGKGKDGLTQPQREAIADLLHYCMYADAKLGLAEAAVFERSVGTFDWESSESLESFANRSIARARRASETREADETFLASAAERLDTESSRRRAIELCTAVLAADGTADPEKKFLDKIKAALA